MMVRVFVGAVLNPVHGKWISLPLSKEELKKEINNLQFGNMEYEIIDIEKEEEFSLDVESYRDVFQLNEDIQRILQYIEEGKKTLLYSALAYRDGSLKNAIYLLEKGNYEFYEGVEDEYSLGEVLVQEGDYVIDPRLIHYIDYEAIGRDWLLNGGQIYPKMKTAFIETSF